MYYDISGYYPYGYADVSGEDYDAGAAGMIDIVGDDYYAFAGEEWDGVAGFAEDVSTLLSGDDSNAMSEVARLLSATSGASMLPRRPGFPGIQTRPMDPRKAAAAQRLAQRFGGLQRQVQQARTQAMAATQYAQAVRPGGPMGGGPMGGRPMMGPTPMGGRPMGPMPMGGMPMNRPPMHDGLSPMVAQQPGTMVVPAAGGGERALQQRPIRNVSMLPVGILSNGPIAPDATVTITVRPQTIFRPVRLHITEDVGQNFLIQSVMIGKDNQFATSGPLPATTFSDSDLEFAWNTCMPGQDISLQVTNVSSSPQPFRAALWGDSAS